jgi:RNA polymerase sigma factor for flagellar operon FliA
MIAKAGSHRKRTPHPRAAGSALTGREAYLWSLYLADRSIANRNTLVEFYLPLLYSLACKAKRTLAVVEVDDLVADGSVGLIHAVETFEPDRGWKFAVFSHRRIKGAMFDAIRRNDPVPRVARQHADKLDNAENTFAERHPGRTPTEKQVAKSLQLSTDELTLWRADAAITRVNVASLSNELFLGLPGHEGVDYLGASLSDLRIANPHVATAVIDWWERILRGLHPTTRAAMILYWRYDWRLKRIGEHLGVSESRVGQACRAAMQQIRNFRKSADFADINSEGASVKLLRLVFPYCSAKRRGRREQIVRMKKALAKRKRRALAKLKKEKAA